VVVVRIGDEELLSCELIVIMSNESGSGCVSPKVCIEVERVRVIFCKAETLLRLNTQIDRNSLLRLLSLWIVQ
jgi:hypothetical protein